MELRLRERFFWFTMMNLMALALTGLVLLAIHEGDLFDLALRSLVLALFDHELLLVVLASSPLFAALAVGLGYRERAARRRRATHVSGSSLHPSSS